MGIQPEVRVLNDRSAIQMKINKKLFFKIHSWIGIKLSILFFIVCFSGTLATLSSEMDWLFNPAIRAKPQATQVDKGTIIKNVQKAYPNSSSASWVAAKEPYLCDFVYIQDNGKRRTVFVNPYTGEVQGVSRMTIQRYFRDLHYYLFIPFQVGHFIVLFFGFLLFISTITALLFYKKWWRKLFSFPKVKGRVAFFRSLHRLVGIWSVPFTILISVTGMWYFLERANIASIKDTANTSTPEIEAIDLDADSFSKIHYHLDYKKIISAAKDAIPNISVKSISPPGRRTRPIYVTGTSDVKLVRNRANRVYIHPISYEVIEFQNAQDINTTTWLNDIADPLHFGYWGGLPTKILWFLGGLGISTLVLTGIWSSLKRKIEDREQGLRNALGFWSFPNWIIFIAMFILMYGSLIYRYDVSLGKLVAITLGWLVVIISAWYVYGRGIKRTTRIDE